MQVLSKNRLMTVGLTVAVVAAANNGLFGSQVKNAVKGDSGFF